MFLLLWARHSSWTNCPTFIWRSGGTFRLDVPRLVILLVGDIYTYFPNPLLFVLSLFRSLNILAESWAVLALFIALWAPSFFILLPTSKDRLPHQRPLCLPRNWLKLTCALTHRSVNSPVCSYCKWITLLIMECCLVASLSCRELSFKEAQATEMN